jgi:HSP20 family protein
MFDAYAKAMGVRGSWGPNGGFFSMGGPVDQRAMQELFKQWQKYVHAEANSASSSSASSSGDAGSLPLDVTSDELKYVVYADVPGLSKSDLSIKLSKDNVLTISGSRPEAVPAPTASDQQQGEPEASTAEPASSYLLRQRPSGSFERKWTLPEDADVAAISAKVSEGVLAITVGKVVQTPPVEEESQDIPWV